MSTAARNSALVGLTALLVSCAEMRQVPPRDAETVYLRGDPQVRSSQSIGPSSSAKRNRVTAATAGPTRAVVADPLRGQRTQLLKRVADLSNEEADSICLTMQLVPREQIFDHSVQPKKILFRYASQAISEADLDYLERVLNDRR